MNSFENKIVANGNDYASRFIASWINAGGGRCNSTFRTWLEELGLSEEDISAISFLATNGKLEYQEHAKKFLAERGIKPVPPRHQYTK